MKYTAIDGMNYEDILDLVYIYDAFTELQAVEEMLTGYISSDGHGIIGELLRVVNLIARHVVTEEEMSKDLETQAWWRIINDRELTEEERATKLMAMWK